MNLYTFEAYWAAKAGEGLSYRDYAKLAKSEGLSALTKSDYTTAADEFDPDSLAKADDETDEDETDEDDDDDAEKSEANDGVDADALVKAIEDYDAVEKALTVGGGSRESYLKARLDAGTITKSEQKELGQLWAGGDALAKADTKSTRLAKSVQDRIGDKDEDAAALVDGSDFLKSLCDSIDDSLGNVLDEVTRDGAATRQLLKAQGSLVKSLASLVVQQQEQAAHQNELIKAMATRLAVVERTPAPRRSVGSHDPRDVRGRSMAKSSVGERQAGDQLTKSQAISGLRQLMVKADAARDENAIAKIAHETAKFESSGELSPEVATAIRHLHGMPAES